MHLDTDSILIICNGNYSTVLLLVFEAGSNLQIISELSAFSHFLLLSTLHFLVDSHKYQKDCALDIDASFQDKLNCL